MLGNNAFSPVSPSKATRSWPSVHNNPNVPKKHLLVANTHIHWNPDHKDVKLIQVQMLLGNLISTEKNHLYIYSHFISIEELSALTAPKSKWSNTPMILAGDFNSTPDSGPYELMTTGQLR